MKLFILFIILNLSSLTFVQAEGIVQAPEVLQADNLKTHPKEVLDAEASIWRIYKNRAGGTGFFIAPKLFVTNFHVLSRLLKATENLDNIHLKPEGSYNILNIEKVVAVSILYDLAIIEIKETSQYYLKLSQSKVKADENLFITGYPSRNFTRMKKIGNIYYETNSRFSFPVNHSIIRGASGSPVLNDQGQVVGVLSKAHTKANTKANTTYVTAIKNKSFKKSYCRKYRTKL